VSRPQKDCLKDKRIWGAPRRRTVQHVYYIFHTIVSLSPGSWAQSLCTSVHFLAFILRCGHYFLLAPAKKGVFALFFGLGFCTPSAAFASLLQRPQRLGFNLHFRLHWSRCNLQSGLNKVGHGFITFFPSRFVGHVLLTDIWAVRPVESSAGAQLFFITILGLTLLVASCFLVAFVYVTVAFAVYWLCNK